MLSREDLTSISIGDKMGRSLVPISFLAYLVALRKKLFITSAKGQRIFDSK